MKASELLPALRPHAVDKIYQGEAANQDSSLIWIDAFYCAVCGMYLGNSITVEMGKAKHIAAMKDRAEAADSQPLLEVALREAKARTPSSTEMWVLLELLVKEVQALKAAAGISTG
jgi:hypothetical protein